MEPTRQRSRISEAARPLQSAVTLVVHGTFSSTAGQHEGGSHGQHHTLTCSYMPHWGDRSTRAHTEVQDRPRLMSARWVPGEVEVLYVRHTVNIDPALNSSKTASTGKTLTTESHHPQQNNFIDLKMDQSVAPLALKPQRSNIKSVGRRESRGDAAATLSGSLFSQGFPSHRGQSRERQFGGGLISQRREKFPTQKQTASQSRQRWRKTAK